MYSTLARPASVCHALILTLLFVATLGCAKAKVDGSVQAYAGELPKPSLVVVHDFAYASDQVSPSSAIGSRIYEWAHGETLSEEQKKLGEAVATELTQTIVQGMTELGFNTVTAAEANPSPEDTLLEIDGQFLKIEEGNRLRRVAIGLGVGQSSLMTHVQVYDSGPLGRVLALGFSTSGRGSYKPGVAEAALVGPVTAGVTAGTSVALGSQETAVADARRTGRLIVARIKAAAAPRGWIDEK